MEVTAEKPTKSIMRTQIGVMTYLAPASTSLDDNILEGLHAEIKKCIQENETQLVIDLSSVQKINSIALEALLDVQEQLIKSGGTLKIVNASQLLGEIFRTTGISDLITILDAGDQSITSSQPVSADKPKAGLGDILIAKGLVKKEQIEDAIDLQQRLGMRMGNIIIDKGWASEKDVLEALGEQMNLRYVRLRKGLYDGEIITI